EARAGYVEMARAELERKLGALKEGKIVALSFNLTVPKDFSSVYKTAISMLEAHTGETIELSADEYRHLVEDEWSWTNEFILSNAGYSSNTRAYGILKGLYDVE